MSELINLLKEVITDSTELFVTACFVVLFLSILKFHNNLLENVETSDKEYVKEALLTYEKVHSKLFKLDTLKQAELVIEGLNETLKYCSKEFFNKYMKVCSEQKLEPEKVDELYKMFLEEYRIFKGKQKWRIVNTEEMTPVFFNFFSKFGFLRIALLLINTFISFYIAVLGVMFIYNVDSMDLFGQFRMFLVVISILGFLELALLWSDILLTADSKKSRMICGAAIVLSSLPIFINVPFVSVRATEAYQVLIALVLSVVYWYVLSKTLVKKARTSSNS